MIHFSANPMPGGFDSDLTYQTSMALGLATVHQDPGRRCRQRCPHTGRGYSPALVCLLARDMEIRAKAIGLLIEALKS